MDLYHCLFFSIPFFCLVVAIPLIMFHGYRYFKNRNHTIYAKRYAFITVYEVGFAIFKYFIDGILFLIIWITDDIMVDSFSSILSIFDLIADLGFYLIVFCMAIRFCLLSFDLNYAASFDMNKWKNIINRRTTMKNDNIGWYLTNKSKYGNVEWIIKVFMPYYMLLFIIDFLDNSQKWFHFSDKIQSIFDIMNSVGDIMAFFPMFCLYFTIPKFKDNLSISGELKRLFFAFILWFIGNTLFNFLPFWGASDITNHFLFFGGQLIVQVSDLSMLLIVTYWVNKQVTNLIKRHNIKSNDIAFSYYTINENVTNKGKHEKSLSTISQAQLTMEFLQILSKEASFNYFISYIIKELSLNQILAFIELIQFEQYAADCKKNHTNCNDFIYNISNDDTKQNETDKELQKWYKEVKFYDAMIKSYIVYEYEPTNNDNNIYVLKFKAHKLFTKYIEFGSSYEADMNINYRIRIISMMEHKHDFLDEYEASIDQLMHIFDYIIDDVFQSLICSFDRFKKSSKYKEMNVTSVTYH